jgi:hypothetical protein
VLKGVFLIFIINEIVSSKQNPFKVRFLNPRKNLLNGLKPNLFGQNQKKNLKDNLNYRPVRSRLLKLRLLAKEGND